LHRVGERLEEVRSAERVDRERDPSLLGEDLLSTKSNRHRLFGRQRPRFVIRIRVERLRAAEHGGERLQGDARDVVERLLRSRRDAGGPGVGAQAQRLGLLRAVALLMNRAQIRRAARSFAISSKKPLWMSKKNERRGAK